MKKSIEFKLCTSSAHQRLLLKLLDKGKSVYNLALSKCKKRLNRLRADKEYQTLMSLRRDLKNPVCDRCPSDRDDRRKGYRY